MHCKRWLAVALVCVGVLGSAQPASAAEGHTFSTVLRVTSSTAMTYPLLWPEMPGGQLTFAHTIACADLGGGISGSAQSNAGQCIVTFAGQYSGSLTNCTTAAGWGYGRLYTTGGVYDFAAQFQLAANTLTFTGTAARNGQTGPMTGSGALTNDPSSGTSCYYGTTTEFMYAGSFTFALT